ncbi:MAG: TlyA family RNA methyltransferase [Erysipelotrichaceae bacterium]
MRLDNYLFQHNLAKSRTYASELIKNNLVMVNNQIVSKASFKVCSEDKIVIIAQLYEYVSRGAYKLKMAIESFKINLTDKVVIDIGASTGGFTDYCLKNNAKYVYAIDVGTDQLVNDLKKDHRVKSLENCDFRDLDSSLIKQPINFICCDVSFISISKILPKIAELSTLECDIILLFKPQFEVGPKHLNKHGIVKDNKYTKLAFETLYLQICNLNFRVLDFVASDILGKKGNQEYLLYLSKKEGRELALAELIKRI